MSNSVPSGSPNDDDASSVAGSSRRVQPQASSPQTPQRTMAVDDNNVLPPTPDSEMSSPPRRGGGGGSMTPLSTGQRSRSSREDPVVPPTPASGDDNDDDNASARSELTPISVLRNHHDTSRGNHPEGPQEGEEDPAMPDNNNDDWGNAATHIRGTDIHVPTAAAAFADFLRTFVSLPHSKRRQQQQERANAANGEHDDDDSSVDSLLMEEDDEDATPLYLGKLDAMIQGGTSNGTASLDIDTQHLYFHSEASQRLYRQLVAYPLEVVPLMDLVVQREVQTRIERLANDDQDHTALLRLQVRPFNLKDTCNLRELDPVAMDSLVSIKGMIVRTSPLIPDLKVAYFGCVICGHGQQVTIDRGRIAEPTGACPVCQTKNSHNLVHNRSVFSDKQLVRLQETPDKVPAGQTPASVLTFCFDDLVDAVQPGDKVELTGVLRAQPMRVHPRMSTLKSVYKTYVDVIHYRTVNGLGSKASTGRTKTQFSPERIEQLKALSRREDIYDQLTASLAPSIWELDDVKKGVLCMLVGGNHGDGPAETENSEESNWLDEDEDMGDEKEGRRNKKRADINILLCGDPGTSKSQLLSYVHKLSTRGVYTSGKGSSAVGLTASVVRDPETRDLVLESGALVLSDLGICCIDEL